MFYLVLCQVFILPHLLLIGSKIYFSPLFGAWLLAVNRHLERRPVILSAAKDLCGRKIFREALLGC
jgi:hypothetical protein